MFAMTIPKSTNCTAQLLNCICANQCEELIRRPAASNFNSLSTPPCSGRLGEGIDLFLGSTSDETNPTFFEPRFGGAILARPCHTKGPL